MFLLVVIIAFTVYIVTVFKIGFYYDEKKYPISIISLFIAICPILNMIYLYRIYSKNKVNVIKEICKDISDAWRIR